MQFRVVPSLEGEHLDALIVPVFKEGDAASSTPAEVRGTAEWVARENSEHKLFVAITAPPLHKDETSREQAANARAFNRWLVEDWLADYPLHNVAVFDFYNVLTSNGGNPDENDRAAPSGNHHRLMDGKVEYVTDQGGDTSAYAYSGDSHPTAVGNQKATAEFLPLLEFYVDLWKAQ